jgi:hypothetical protein
VDGPDGSARRGPRRPRPGLRRDAPRTRRRVNHPATGDAQRPLSDGRAALVVTLHTSSRTASAAWPSWPTLSTVHPSRRTPSSRAPHPAGARCSPTRRAPGSGRWATSRQSPATPLGHRRIHHGRSRRPAAVLAEPADRSAPQPRRGARRPGIGAAGGARPRRDGQRRCPYGGDQRPARGAVSPRGNVDRFVISVPVASRRSATAAHLGNEVGVMTVPVTVAGNLHQRLAVIALTTRNRRPATPSASAALLGPVFLHPRVAGRLPVVRQPAAPGDHHGHQPPRPGRPPVLPRRTDHRDHPSVADHRERHGRIRCAVVRGHPRCHTHGGSAVLPRSAGPAGPTAE